jgi:hypothetical protein
MSTALSDDTALGDDPVAACCHFEVVDGVANFMGSSVRVDKECKLVSVTDVIMTLEECSVNAARLLKKRLTKSGKITEGSNGFTNFIIGNHK